MGYILYPRTEREKCITQRKYCILGMKGFNSISKDGKGYILYPRTERVK